MRSTFLLSIVLVAGVLPALAGNDCMKRYALLKRQDASASLTDSQLIGVNPTASATNKDVDIIWLGYHMELRVDNEAFNLYGGPRKPHNYKALERLAKSKSWGGFVNFKLSVSAKEYEALKAFLYENQGKSWPLQSCVGGVCKALRETTSINVPIPLRYSPTLTAAYAAVAKTLGSPQIVGIELVGRPNILSYLAMSAIEPLGALHIYGGHLSLGLTAGAAVYGAAKGAFLVVDYVTDSGERKRLAIPVETH